MPFFDNDNKVEKDRSSAGSSAKKKISAFFSSSKDKLSPSNGSSPSPSTKTSADGRSSTKTSADGSSSSFFGVKPTAINFAAATASSPVTGKASPPYTATATPTITASAASPATSVVSSPAPSPVSAAPVFKPSGFLPPPLGSPATSISALPSTLPVARMDNQNGLDGPTELTSPGGTSVAVPSTEQWAAIIPLNVTPSITGPSSTTIRSNAAVLAADEAEAMASPATTPAPGGVDGGAAVKGSTGMSSPVNSLGGANLDGAGAPAVTGSGPRSGGPSSPRYDSAAGSRMPVAGIAAGQNSASTTAGASSYSGGLGGGNASPYSSAGAGSGGMPSAVDGVVASPTGAAPISSRAASAAGNGIGGASSGLSFAAAGTPLSQPGTGASSAPSGRNTGLTPSGDAAAASVNAKSRGYNAAASNNISNNYSGTPGSNIGRAGAGGTAMAADDGSLQQTPASASDVTSAAAGNASPAPATLPPAVFSSPSAALRAVPGLAAEGVYPVAVVDQPSGSIDGRSTVTSDDGTGQHNPSGDDILKTPPKGKVQALSSALGQRVAASTEPTAAGSSTGERPPRPSPGKLKPVIPSNTAPTSPVGDVPPSTAQRPPRVTISSLPMSTYDKQNTVNASQLLKLASFKLQPMRDFVPYDELLKLRLEDGIDPTRKEEYLDEEEFTRVFGVSRADFKKLPAWKQSQAKKKLALF